VRPRWSSGPVEIVLVRHGESTGNEADRAARDAGADELDLEERDADVALSQTGRTQADALATWLERLDGDQRPTRVITSPYLRAADTARVAMETLGVELEVDERLRERDLGILDGLTGRGIRNRHPDEATRRDRLGKFYYQPPSGESWADVVLRVRSLLNDLREGYDGERVWLFSHQAVIMSFRYVLEGLSEQDVLDIDRGTPIPNASITRYRRAGDLFELEDVANTEHLEETDATVTRQPPEEERRAADG
jgi:broad specificity phosphatase PhoE